MEESAQPWITKDSDNTVKSMLAETEKARTMAQYKERYKIIADLMAGRSSDITGDVQIFAHVNRPRTIDDDERLTLEEYMKLFPESCAVAMQAVKDRRQADEKDFNPTSLAKWRNPGIMPVEIHQLFFEMYPDSKKRALAFRRFFNMFPKFRISSKPV